MRGGSRRRAAAVSLLLIGALLLSACNGGSDEPERAEAPDTTVPRSIVKLGVVAPLSGPFAVLGQGIRNAVDLAVDQANEEQRIPGWEIELVAEDDAGSADTGAQKATSLAADPAIVGVVGAVNESVTARVQPILAEASIATVSPASAGVGLTRKDDRTRPFPSYFSLAAPTEAQGPFGADFATDDLNVKNVVTIHDGKLYGSALVQSFTAELALNGASVSAAEVVNPTATDFGPLLDRIRPLNPDLIFYGGEHPQGQALTVQAKAGGIRAPIMGGDGLFDEAYITSAKAAAEGDLAVAVGATNELDGSGPFLEAYEAADYPEPASAYGAHAYDAANVLIDALTRVLSDRTKLEAEVRSEVVAAVQDTSVEGVTGQISFDPFGETTAKVLSVYRVTNGAWAAVKTDEAA